MRLLGLLGIVFLLIGCDLDRSGFTKHPDGFWYKIDSLGIGDSLSSEDVAVFEGSLSGVNGLLLKDSNWVVELDRCKPLLVSFANVFQLQDIISFKAPASYWKSLGISFAGQGEIRARWKLVHIEPAVQYRYFKHYPEAREDLEMEEQERISQFLDTCSLAFRYTKEVFVAEIESGRGETAARGEDLLLSFEGFLLSGEKIDSTVDRGEDFTYQQGAVDQMIPGLDHLCSQMRAGEKMVVLVPSKYAYGEEGTMDSLVPPFSPVVYYLHCKAIKS